MEALQYREAKVPEMNYVIIYRISGEVVYLLGIFHTWKTMKEKNISQYRLVKAYGFSAGQLNRLKNNQYVSTHTIGVLCTILECSVEDIMEFRMDKSEGLYPIMETVSIQPEEDEAEEFEPEESEAPF